MPSSDEFYDVLIDHLKHRWGTVDIYSTSACFGFWTKGMRMFSRVLAAMSTSLRTHERFRVQRMRLLLWADDNPIDAFGVERFHIYFADTTLNIRRLAKPTPQEDWLQFVVFDERLVLSTHPQQGYFDDVLGLAVNTLAPAVLQSDPGEVLRHVDLFNTSWQNSAPFDYPLVPTINDLVHALQRSFPIDRTPGASEKDHEEHLYHFLHGLCDPGIINRQYTLGDDRLDFVLGDPRTSRAIAIELKLATAKESERKRLIGQIKTYQKVMDVLVVVIGSNVSAPKMAALRREFKDYDHVRILHLK